LRGWSSNFCFHVRRAAPIVPDLAPAKVLMSGTFVPTRRRSWRASQTAESAAAASEPPRPATEVRGLRQEVAAMVAVTAAATAVSEVPPVPVPATVD
jgi:hypothetical protein